MLKMIWISFVLVLSPIVLAQTEKQEEMLTENMDQTMSQQEMERIVKEMADEAKGESGVIEFIYQGIVMYLMSDVQHNRMRIISPIAEYNGLDKEVIDQAMQANFHTALDARYAVSDGVLYAAYIHPIAELEPKQLMFAVHQVANLAATFGTKFSSGALQFGGQVQDQKTTPNTIEL